MIFFSARRKLQYSFWRGRPVSNLLLDLLKKDGRNQSGKITVRHLGASFHKRQYRLIDFSRLMFFVPALLLRIEKDPNRKTFLALLSYFNGFISYVLLADGVNEFNFLSSSFFSTRNLVKGNMLPLFSLPNGKLVFNIELRPFSGGQLARSAGSYAQLLGSLGFFSIIKLSSGVLRLIPSTARATLGRASNINAKFLRFVKAGSNRHLGKKPHVRGVAMNPVDHPHGGGQGKTSGGRPSVSFTARLTKGKPTVKKGKKWWLVGFRRRN